jgi:hypothetical protein
MSTTTSYRETLLTNLVTDLGTISVANSFRTNLGATVSRMLKTTDEMDEEDFPTLFVADGVENITYGTNKEIKSLFNVLIYGYVRYDADAQSSQIASTQLNKLISDVKEIVMNTSLTLWQTAGVVFVRIVKVETDEGVLDPDAIFSMQIEIEYWTGTTDMGASI